MFDKIHAQRLTALADHLDRAEVLKVGTFNFQYVFEKLECGTMGCAMGESALLWPEAFPGCIEANAGYFTCGDEFFGTTDEESDHLFLPNRQDTASYGGVMLTESATRYEVAANIRAFLEAKARQA